MSAAPQGNMYNEALADTPNAFIKWLTEDTLLKIGALLLLISFGWFVSYAFANNWIGPVGRITLGLFAGVLILAFGTWRSMRHTQQGAVFLLLGAGTILMTLFAARELYDFLTPGVALLVMFVSVAYVALVSVVRRIDWLAVAVLVLASIAPLLTNTSDPSVGGLLGYLLVVVLGSVWVVRLTGNHLLTLIGVIVMGLYSLGLFDARLSTAEEALALWLSFVFAGIFLATNTLSILYRDADRARTVHIATALLTGTYLTAWILMAVPSALQSLAFVGWMLVFSVATFLVYSYTNNRVPFYIYGAVTIGFLFAATGVELSGPALVLMYTAQVAAIIISVRLFLARKVSYAVVWLLTLPVVLSLESFGARAWFDGVLHSDFLILVLVGAVLAGVGVLYQQTGRVNQAGETEGVSWLSTGLLILAGLYLVALIWLVLHAVLPGDSAVTAALITYSLMGIGALLLSSTLDSRAWQIVGGVLLGGVVLRLLLVDVWEMELVGRIITFFIIGLLLISTAFIKKRQSNADTIDQPYENR
jgi:uncharacterized membrane protein